MGRTRTMERISSTFIMPTSLALVTWIFCTPDLPFKSVPWLPYDQREELQPLLPVSMGYTWNIESLAGLQGSHSQILVFSVVSQAD